MSTPNPSEPPRKPRKKIVPNPRPSELDPSRRKPLLDSNRFILICERYAETGLARSSCDALGVNYETVMTAIRDQSNRGDETWAELWAESYEKFKESLEREIFKRGRDGTITKFAVDKKTGLPARDAEGKLIPLEVQYSDRMLELAARGHMPERYRDKVLVAGSVGLEPMDVFQNLSFKAKREIRAIIMRDLEEQRQSGTIIDGDALALEDLRDNGDDNE